MEKKVIEQKVLEIKEIVDRHTNSLNTNYGLFGGMSGELFFLYHCNKLIPNSIPNFERKIDILLESVKASRIYNISFCSGLSGLLYLFEIMHKDSFLDIDVGSDVNDLFMSNFYAMLASEKYELLYGLMGICQLFTLNKARYKNQIVDIIECLNNSKIPINGGYTWKRENDNGFVYDLSLSHGISSIIVFLSRIVNDDLFINYQQDIKDLLSGTIKYILSQQLDRKKFISYFPYNCNYNGPIESNSRLGWCYGDLSVGIALYQASIVCKDNNLKEFVDEMFRYTAKDRRNLIENSVIDASLCHGTSGIASIFYRMWWNEKKDEYAAASEYWIRKTIELAKYEHGPAGYLYGYRTFGLTPAYHLLEGISGVGIVLLYYLYQMEPEWDYCMQLN